MFRMCCIGDTRILGHRCLSSNAMRPGGKADIAGSEVMCQMEVEDRDARLLQDHVKRV